jgi:hypothetical protein
MPMPDAMDCGRSGKKSLYRKNGWRCALLTILLFCLITPQLALASDVMMTIAKDTLLGGTVGLVLGGTLTLVTDEDNRSDTVRWGIVIGTFAGFGLGVYEAMHPQDELFGGTDDLGLIENDSPLFTGLMKAEGIGQSRQLREIAPSAVSGLSFKQEWDVKIPLLSLSW